MKRRRDDTAFLDATESTPPQAAGSPTFAQYQFNDTEMQDKFLKMTKALLSDHRIVHQQLRYFPEDLIEWIIQKSRATVMSEPMLVAVDAPVSVCGDIHGQLHDLVELINVDPPPNGRFLFLGDYVDRGKSGIECITILLGFKILYPKRFWLLRGNHECVQICRQYGFFEECKRRYSIRLFKKFCDVFNILPVAALVEGRALCMHGGLSPELRSLEQIEMLSRPCDVGENGLVTDLLWSDPDESVNGWGPNRDRGVSYFFGKDVVQKFVQSLDIDLIIRAHQVQDHGYHFFTPDRQLVTVFSASNYCGEFTNYGAMLQMDENLQCKFRIFAPDFARMSHGPTQDPAVWLARVQ